MSMYSKYNVRNSSTGVVAREIDAYVSRGIPSLMSNHISRENTLKLVRECPELFNLQTLGNEEKAALLISGYNVFKKYFDPADFPRAIRFALFLSNTKRYEKYVDFSKISGIDMELLLKRRPSYVNNVPENLKKKFSYIVWRTLLDRNFAAQAPSFLDNIESIKVKTELRDLYTRHPHLFRMTKPEHIEKMVLTPKDFLLLSDKTEIRNAKVKLRESTIEAIRDKLVITVLKGVDRQSTQLRNALGRHK